jgi:uncharacterized membrane protein YfcA
LTSTAEVVLLLGAGALGGVVGTAGGITSLISYPALLAIGLPALRANVTNLVSAVALCPGSALASRPELAGQGPWLRRWAFVAAAGSLAGSGLLLGTPGEVFGHVVPFLLVFASIGLLLQPRLSRWIERHLVGGNHYLLAFGLFSVSVYNGYFGAGSGVMVLAVLLLTVDQDPARANALKNMVLGLATVASAAVFAFLGRVDWAAVVPLTIGMFLGGTVGPVVARRVPGDVLRWLVALTGIGLAIRLWIAPG